MDRAEHNSLSSGHADEPVTTHLHDENIRRLKSAEGHLRGIQHMLEEDQYCIDVIHQIRAVQAALNKVTTNILEQHLNSCVISALNGGDTGDRQRVLNELMDVFAASNRS